MPDHLPNYRKGFTTVACTSLLLLSNNSELCAKFLVNNEEVLFELYAGASNRNAGEIHVIVRDAVNLEKLHQIDIASLRPDIALCQLFSRLRSIHLYSQDLF